MDEYDGCDVVYLQSRNDLNSCPHSTHLYTRPRVDRCALKVNHTPDSAPPVCLNAFASPGPGNRGASISFGPLAIAPPWKVIDDAIPVAESGASPETYSVVGPPKPSSSGGADGTGSMSRGPLVMRRK